MIRPDLRFTGIACLGLAASATQVAGNVTTDGFVVCDQGTVTPSSAAVGFGQAVSVSGSVAVVGAPYASCPGGDFCGAAYVFTWDGAAWTEQQNLTPPDVAADDYFGDSVSVSGDVIAVGAPYDDDAGNGSGSVYVFRREGQTWVQVAKLNVAGGASLGRGVSVDGQTLAAIGMGRTGYVYHGTGSSWVQAGSFTIEDLALQGSAWTLSISLSGPRLVVGAYQATCFEGGLGNCGAAYVFRNAGGLWTFEQKLVRSDPWTDWLGWSVAIEGTRVIVGAPMVACGAPQCGAAHIFELIGGAWVDRAELIAGETDNGDRFGWSVSLTGDLALVGARSANVGNGGAYLFLRDTGVWVEVGELLSSNPGADWEFGVAVSLEGASALVGEIPFGIPTGGSANLFSIPKQNVYPIVEGGDASVHVIGAPATCPGEAGRTGDGAPRAGCGPGPFIDPWISTDLDADNPVMCHNFGSPSTQPIPADFFDPGSDVFDGIVCLTGVPLGLPEYGDADTLIERSADPFDRCALASPEQLTVDLEIVDLSLASTGPISVTYGGQNPEGWDVTVDLAPGGLPPSTPPSTLTATKTHCNGGTYTSTLYVQPRFTFTKVSDPGVVRVFDTGLEGADPVVLEQTTSAPWIGDVDENIDVFGDVCSSFHAGIGDRAPVTACDCNENLIRDKCDIETGFSLDEDGNGVPDECEMVPSVTEWGMVAMTLLVLTAGTLVCARRHAARV